MGTLNRNKVLNIIKTAQEKGSRPDFSGAYLSQLDLSEACLIGAYFIGADLNQANLNQANLSGADLSQANLSGAHLRGTNLGAAYLSRAKIDHAALIRASFNRAHVIGADLSRSNLSGAYLNEANFSGANLSGADLSGADLSDVNLIWADLSQANLSGADLSRANLSEADLSEANLSDANLTEADIFRVNLNGADLSRANLSGADLCQAKLTGANLIEANINRAKFDEVDLSGAVIGLTSWGDINLSVIKGLELVEHRAPSTLGTDTLFRSQGQVPEVFLRGCGLSDVQIETAKLNNPHLAAPEINAIAAKIQGLLVERTIRSCRIIYAGQDQVFAQKLHDDLQQQGIRCWFAPEALKIGVDNCKSTPDRSFRLYDKLLLVLSEYSIKSNWVEKEVKAAFNEEDRRGEMVLLPLQLDETLLKINPAWAANIRRTQYIGDFSRWQDQKIYQQSFVQLLQDLGVARE